MRGRRPRTPAALPPWSRCALGGRRRGEPRRNAARHPAQWPRHRGTRRRRKRVASGLNGGGASESNIWSLDPHLSKTSRGASVIDENRIFGCFQGVSSSRSTATIDSDWDPPLLGLAGHGQSFGTQTGRICDWKSLRMGMPQLLPLVD